MSSLYYRLSYSFNFVNKNAKITYFSTKKALPEEILKQSFNFNLKQADNSERILKAFREPFRY